MIATATNARSGCEIPMNGNCSNRRKLSTARTFSWSRHARSVSAQTDSRSRRSTWVSAGNSPSVQRASAALNSGTRAARQADRLRPLEQRVAIPLLLVELRIEPALAEAEDREHHPLGLQLAQHPVSITAAAAGSVSTRRLGTSGSAATSSGAIRATFFASARTSSAATS